MRNHHDIGRMPVVKDSNPRKMIGWMNRVDLIRAYDIALAKRTATRHTLAQVRLGAASGAEVFEYEVASGSVVDGKLLAKVPWPEESLVASIQRGERLIIPHGNTVLEAGDRLAIVARTTDEGAVRALVRCDVAG